MKGPRAWRCGSRLPYLWILPALLAMTSMEAAGDRPFDRLPMFEFSDDFYRANGVKPEFLLDRLNAQDERSVVEVSPHPDFRDIRILETTGGFQHNSDLFYYAVNAKIDTVYAFTDGAAGEEALNVAESFVAYIFPKADGDPLEPAPPNRRQDNVFDDRNGYLSNNPLGLWLLTFVSWDGPNVNDPECRRAMNRVARRNGRDLDGTPVLKTVGEIEDFVDAGCLTLRTRNIDGSQGFRWVV